MVWVAEKSQRCPTCGTSQWEWDDNPDAWFADHDVCEGCRRVDVHRKYLLDAPGDQHGVHIRMYRTPRE